MDIKTFILTGLRSLPADYGKISEINNTNDDKIIIIFTIGPNVGMNLSLLKMLEFFINTRLIELVACEGAFGKDGPDEVDTRLLTSISDETIKQMVVDDLFKKGVLYAPEYLRVLGKWPFILYGPEDRNTYLESHKLFIKVMRLYDYMIDFATKFQTPLNLMNKIKNYEIKQIFKQMRETIPYEAYTEMIEICHRMSNFFSILEMRQSLLSKNFNLQQSLCMAFSCFLLIFIIDVFYKNIDIYRKAENKRKAKFIFLDDNIRLRFYSWILSEREVEVDEIEEMFNEVREHIPFKEYEELINLFDSQIKFAKLLDQRSSIILNNLLKKMDELGVNASALVCFRFLAASIAEKMKKNNLSYVRIEPFTSVEDDRDSYRTYRKIMESPILENNGK